MSDHWQDVAAQKLSNVVGATRAAVVMREALAACGLTRLESADDLHRFACVLIANGGFEGAIGGLLSLHAVVHGARAS